MSKNDQLRALSIRRPWANLIIEGYKTVENRTWEPPAGTMGTEIVVHAGRTWEPAGAELAADLGLTGFSDPHQCPGGYLGMVRLSGVHLVDDCCAPWGQRDPGTFHWVLAEHRPFPAPVPARGRLGLFWVPTAALPG